MAAGVKTGGRQKGSLNKATAEIKKIAGKYTREAVEILASIARKSDSDAARVAAVKELLDRGHGKASQPLTGPDDGPIQTHQVIEQIIVDPKA